MTDSLSRLAAALADRYRIERELGHGGMATVYLAQDLRHRRRVAVKVLRQDLAAVIGADRFLKEIETTANLQHPNILPLYDSGEADAFLYYVMPYVEGETLRGKLTREKQLSVEETVAIARSVAAALEYAHRRGVIHRDIKPENILLPDGQALVADFGIALAVSQAGGTRMTETGLSLGTPHYMSPEQATGDRELNARSDIYSLGAMTYEMLTGDPPHTGSTVQAIVAKVLSEQPTPISRTRHLVPANVDAAVQRALAKTPADRFASAADFAAALSNPGFTLPTTSMAAQGSSRRIDRVSRGSALGLAAGLAAISAIAVWGWLGRPDPPAALVTRILMALPPGQDVSDTYGQRFALSRDGRTLVYVGEAPNAGRQLWVRPLASLESRALEGTLGAMGPFVSPTGDWVGFIADGKLRKVPMAGGPVVVLADSANQTLAGGAWLDDGTIVFTHDNWSLYRVSENGGAVTRMPPVERQGVIFPQPLPRPDAVLYTTCDNACARMTVGALDLTTGKVVPLAEDATNARYSATGHVVYLRRDGAVFRIPFDPKALEPRGAATPMFDGVQLQGGTTAAFALSPGGTLVYASGAALRTGEMVRVDREGKATPVDPDWPPMTLFAASLSPDGTKLALDVNEGPRNDIWIKVLDKGPLTRLTIDGRRSIRPAWTPDGRAVSFITADSSWSVTTRRPDGIGEPTVIVPPDSLGEPESATWAPNREWLVLQVRKAGRRDLQALKIGTDTVLPVAAMRGVDEIAPAISPDGRWIAYASTETGRGEVYVRSFPDVKRERHQISTMGARHPAWAVNGRELYFVTDSRTLMATDVTPGSEFRFGTPRALFSTADFAQNTYYRGYLPEPGGQSFLFSRLMRSNNVGQLVLVLNWGEELKAKAVDGGNPP